jgi:DNA repair protein RadC
MSLISEHPSKSHENKYKRVQIISLKMVKECSLKYLAEKIPGSSAAAEIAKKFLADADREHFIAMYLDTRNTITAIHTISIGTVDSSLIHPREVFKGALLSNASALIIAHNHPSGNVVPSEKDIKVTKILKKAGEILGIKLLDHIIVGEKNHMSFSSEGLI